MDTNFFIFFFLTLLVAPSPSQSQSKPQHTTYSTVAFSSFNETNRDNFILSSDSSVAQGALQITPDSTNNPDLFLSNKSGRVFYKNPFRIFDKSTNSTKIVSFNTTFEINIFRVSNTSGEGFSFIIAPNTDEPPLGSYGQYLGLTNSSIDGSASNHFVAIEFDTVKQPFDIDDNHIGLDINSVNSTVAKSLTPFGIKISPAVGTVYNVWIDYDGDKKFIWVYMGSSNQSKPKSADDAILKHPLDLSKYVMEKSYFGFAASTGLTERELNCVKAWNLTIERLPDDPKKKNNSTLILAICIPIILVGISFIAVVRLFCVKKKRGDEINKLDSRLRTLPGTTREFEYKLLRKATNNFDEKMELGKGGYGVVYKGVIPEENTEVAVKKFSRQNMEDDFLAEVSIINRLRHKHLVRLNGWCHHNGELFLVYDYMPNGSLDHHLYSPPNSPTLTWPQRYNIISGLTSALHYLHDQFDQKVIHRDLKASNILLDSNFNARLGDFGLARAIDTDKTSYIEQEQGFVQGTIGYIAPECFHTGKATSESDVFAFGVVVLEVVCGRRPKCNIGGFQFLADWVWKLHREGRILDAVDPRLENQFSKEDAQRLLLLGLACQHPLGKERPKTSRIVQIVMRSVGPPVVPPFRPAFVWPAMDFVTDDEYEGTTTKTSIDVSSPYASSGWPNGVSGSFKTLKPDGPGVIRVVCTN